MKAAPHLQMDSLRQVYPLSHWNLLRRVDRSSVDWELQLALGGPACLGVGDLQT